MTRSQEITKLSQEIYESLNDKLDYIANQLENGMELSHFLSGLDNRLAIMLNTKMAQKTLDAKREIIELLNSNNPYPKDGDIQEVQFFVDFCLHKLWEDSKYFLGPYIPDDYTLVIKYKKIEYKYQSLNVNKYTFLEIKNNLLKNMKIELDEESWPSVLSWGDVKFNLISYSQVENEQSNN